MLLWQKYGPLKRGQLLFYKKHNLLLETMPTDVNKVLKTK